MPRHICPSSYVCDCGHEIHFCESTVWEMQKISLRRRSGVGEGDDRHGVIFDKGEWVAIFCPKIEAEIPAHPARPAPLPPAAKRRARRSLTHRQGQALAFIHLYTKLNRRPAAEADVAKYFRIAAPTAHSLVEALTKAGLISREPGKPRSIRVLVDPSKVPQLE